MKYDPRQVLAAFQRLSPRERTLLGLALGALLVVGLYTLAWEPLVEGRERMARQIAARQKQLEEVERLRTRYFELTREFEAGQRAIARPDEKIELFPHIESTVSQVVSRDHIVSMSPQTKVIANTYKEESVELKLINLSLEQFVDMMYRIEKGAVPLRVTKLNIKKRPRDPRSFDVTATVSMLTTVEG